MHNHLQAHPINSPTCSSNGISLDGNDDYIDIDDFEFGGITSFEVYVKYDSFNYHSPVYDFSNGVNSDNVRLNNFSEKSDFVWYVLPGRGFSSSVDGGWNASIWTHVIVTVSGNSMNLYKNV
ncbi:hypothetical protein TL16_g10437 [Triparma laevis f. inornata]|uniref:Uncharacterized protein n=1 Tax=Triparma laevis f. inornata TaxID=1714386 RepID=A0A9W7EME7_9STRA|nr:hypothetical protein TL16_g10437 [Triparma laevis f. inornata]